MPTLEVSYGQPSGYYSGSSPASKTVSRLDYAGYPEDSYTNYKVTSYYAEWDAQVYISAGVSADFETNGASFSKSMGEAQSTETFSKTGSSLSNKILDFNNTGSMTVDVSRNGGTGTGNCALFKSSIYIRVEYEYAYTPCSAPTSVSVGTSTPAAGGSTTLSWSGAKAGDLNPITKYEIYRSATATGSYSLLDTVTTSATSGSLKVTAPSTMGNSYYYKVKTIGTVSGYDSGLSGYTSITAKTITACGAPTSISISPTTIDKGSTTTLSWSGATAGTNNAITAYQIYRSTDNSSFALDQTYQTTSTSGSLKLTLSPAEDTTYYYKILTVGTVSGYNSGYSSVVNVKVLTYTNCGTIAAKVETRIAEGTVKLTWDAASDGRNNPVSGYQVQYQDSADGSTWGSVTNLTSLSASTLEYDAALNANRGSYRRYLITPLATKEGFNGAISTTASVKTNCLPDSPTFLCFGGDTVYNKKPWVRFSLAADADGQSRVVYCNDAVLCECPASAGTFAAQVPIQLSLGQNQLKIVVSDGLANGSENLKAISVESIADSATPDTCEAENYNNLCGYINALRTYYNLPEITFAAKVRGNLVKAQETNEMLSALAEIHNLLPTTNKFDLVKKGDLITKKTYNQIYEGITGG